MVFEEDFINKGIAAKMGPKAFTLLMCIAISDHLEYEDKPTRGKLMDLSGLVR